MKTRIIISILAGVLFAGFLFAQSIVISGGRRFTKYQSYDPKTRPSLALPEAYALALNQIGPKTNQFHCLTASCIEMTNNGFTGWRFTFSNTNGQRVGLSVFFDGWVHIDNPGSEALWQK
jgi:hypothetical protein